ncbi:MAG TPA: aminoacyl-tRNA hydrolase [Gammaproteobacteria bacterium]
MGQDLELIVGLGNPGPEHQRTRHNAGFWFVDILAQAHGGSFRSESKFHGDAGEVTIGNHRIRLLKPLTYMNASGRSILAMATFYKIPSENILVAYDELDLEPGRAQLRFDGGHGGHNGMRDVVRCLGSEFWRLRLGIGHPGQGRRDDVVNYVLRPASAEDEDEIIDAINAAIEAVKVFIDQGPERAKTQLHSRGVKPRAYRKQPENDSGSA